MAEESEKKQAFVVHKKQADSNQSPAQTAPKKKVVVVKKKTPAPAAAATANAAKKVVVKRPETENAATAEEPKNSSETVTARTQSAPVQKQEKSENKERSERNDNRPQQRKTTFELNSARPNVKAGNLSDYGRRDRNGGYNGNRGGYNNGGNGGYNGNRNGGYQNREGGGFTGAQARQGYQNRERDIFQKDIEQFFSVGRSTVTNILQLMEKKGFVRRESVESDARLKKVILTDKGIEAQETIEKIVDHIEKELSDGIVEEELQLFYKVIDRISENVEKYAANGSRGEEPDDSDNIK